MSVSIKHYDPNTDCGLVAIEVVETSDSFEIHRIKHKCYDPIMGKAFGRTRQYYEVYKTGDDMWAESFKTIKEARAYAYSLWDYECRKVD